MLKEYKSMTQEEMYTLVHEIYIEGCMENAGKYLLCSGKRQYACKCRQIK